MYFDFTAPLEERFLGILDSGDFVYRAVNLTFLVLVYGFSPTVNVLFRDERITKIREHPRNADHRIGADKRLGQK